MLEIKNLNCFYKEAGTVHKVFSGFSTCFEDNSFVCLTGPNGSGKSTLLSVIADVKKSNLETGKSLSVCFENKNLCECDRLEKSKYISLLTQNETCVWNYKAFDFALNGRFCHTDGSGIFSKKDKEITEEIFELLNITELKNKNINSMSFGEFQKVRIARTFIQQSKVMLLDEPAASLDFNAAFLLLKKIKEISKEKQITVAASIHDLNLASIFADKILMLSKNAEQKKYEGTTTQILIPEIIGKVYNTKCKTFMHPEYKVPQVYVSEN